MTANDIKTGLRVVRSKGDYVVGRVGTVVALDNEKQRAQVQWDGETKTWVSYSSMEDASHPYKIQPASYNNRTGRWSNSKYVRL